MKIAGIDSSSVFLVSGGARGITAECVIRLAQQAPGKWILLGRSRLAATDPSWAEGCTEEAELKKRIMQSMQAQGEKPTPKAIQQQYKSIVTSRDIRKTLSALNQAGNQAVYLNVDVTDLDGLRQALSTVAHWGKITGIIHGAGNLADKWIENKTEQDFENVYTAKVHGLENLLNCVPLEQLQHLVLFSSVAGFFGSAGQADYALANEILNKSAHLFKQRSPNCHVISINWGPWDSGMVTPELKRAFSSRGIEVIPIDVGTQLFAQEFLPRYHSETQVVIGSPILPPPAELNHTLQSYRIRRQLLIETNPILLDHTIGGHPVLPAACVASWIATTCEQLYPGYRCSAIENLKILKGIVFNGLQAEVYVVDIQELEKNVSENEVRFEIRIWSEQDNGKIRFHYSAQATLRLSIPSPAASAHYSAVPEQAIAGQVFYQNKALFHGTSLQGIQHVWNVTPKGLTMQCLLPKIPEAQQGQFYVNTLNPYTTDVLIQSVLVWVRQMHQPSALPIEIQQITQFKAIPFDRPFQAVLEIQMATDSTIVASITAYDADSEILMRLSGMKYVMMPQLVEQFQQSTPKTSQPTASLS